MDLHQLTLSEMLRRIERGECTAIEIVTQCRERLEALEPQVHAWVDPEPAGRWLSAWRGDQERFARLPLQGLPLGVKDTIDVRGRPAERGSAIWKRRVASEDAACVAALRAAGLSVAGKTVTTEFAYFSPGPTTNPFHLEHTPGGSSSGSAAAVATQMVPVALGSQTAASVIRPASYCGVVGYVASTGSFSLRGVMPLAWSFDSLGILARSVEDVQRIRSALGAIAGGPFAQQRPSSVLAFDGDAFGAIDASMRDAFDSALTQLAAAGVRVERAGGLTHAAKWVALHQRIMSFEAARTLAFEFENFADQLSPALRNLIEEGRTIGDSEEARLFEQREFARTELLERWAGIDMIIAPAAPGPAPHGLAATGLPFMSRPWQLFGLPQATLPLARDPCGLPLGIQLIGRGRDDDHLLRMVRWCEREFDWSFVPPTTLAALLTDSAPSNPPGRFETL